MRRDSKRITERYINGAVRVAKAGFDGLEINTRRRLTWGIRLSRFWNKRTDIYGTQKIWKIGPVLQ